MAVKIIQDFPDGSALYDIDGKQVKARNFKEAFKQSQQVEAATNNQNGQESMGEVPASRDPNRSVLDALKDTYNAIDSTGNAVINGAIDGATLGFGKYADGATNALIHALLSAVPFSGYKFSDIPAAYDEGVDAYKRRLNISQKERPITTSASEFGGALAPLLIPGIGQTVGRTNAQVRGAALLSRLGGVASKIGSEGLVGRTALGGATGAGYGALDALGHEQDPVEGAKYGAIGGAALGAGSKVFSPLASKLGGLVGNNAAVNDLVAGGATKKALKKFEKIQKRAGISIDDIQKALKDAQESGVDTVTVADILRNSGQRALSGLNRGGGEPSNVISEQLQKRAVDEPRRLVNYLEDATGTDVTAAQNKINLRADQRDFADADYLKAAAETPLVDIAPFRAYVDELLNNRSGNPVSRTGESYKALKGKVRNRLGDEGDTTQIPFKDAHELKKDLQSYALNAKINNDYVLKNTYDDVANKLRQMLIDGSPSLKEADKRWRSYQLAQEASDLGQKAGGTGRRAADVINEFNKLSPAEQEAYKIGYANNNLSKIEKGGNVLNQLRSNFSEQVNPVVFGEDAAARLAAQRDLELLQRETNNRVLGGSRTADNLADIAGINSGDVLSGAVDAIHNPAGAAIRGATKLVGKGVDRFRHLNENDKVALTNILLQRPDSKTKDFFLKLVEKGEMDKKNQRLLEQYLAVTGAKGNNNLFNNGGNQ